MSTTEELEFEAAYEAAIEASEKKHSPECGRYCPYPDTQWISPGASLPKCRGGDCTLCDELDCSCGKEPKMDEDEYTFVFSGEITVYGTSPLDALANAKKQLDQVLSDYSEPQEA